MSTSGTRHDPTTQRLHVISLQTRQIHETLRCGTGKRGLGFGPAQTPTGFFTIGGVRIARNSDPAIQTGDSKTSLQRSAGPFDPTAHPNATLQALINSGQVTQYRSTRLGAPIYILNRP